MATGDKLVNLDDLKEVYTKVDGDVGELKSALNTVGDDTYELAERTVSTTTNNYKLKEDGYSAADANYKLLKYTVTAGDVVKVVSDHLFQFQSHVNVTSSGAQYRIGETYGAGTYYLKTPETATYLIVSTTKENSTATVYGAESAFDVMPGTISDIIEDEDIKYRVRMVSIIEPGNIQLMDKTQYSIIVASNYKEYRNVTIDFSQNGIYYPNPFGGIAQIVQARFYDAEGTELKNNGTSFYISIENIATIERVDDTHIVRRVYSSLNNFYAGNVSATNEYTLDGTVSYFKCSIRTTNMTYGTDIGVTYGEASLVYIPYGRNHQYNSELSDAVWNNWVAKNRFYDLPDRRLNPWMQRSYAITENILDDRVFDWTGSGNYYVMKPNARVPVVGGKTVMCNKNMYTLRLYKEDGTSVALANTGAWQPVEIPSDVVSLSFNVYRGSGDSAVPVDGYYPVMLYYVGDRLYPYDEVDLLPAPMAQINGWDINKNVYDYAVPDVESNLVRMMKTFAIREINRQKDAFRIGTFNIYVNNTRTNRPIIKKELETYGLDICCFQEARTMLENGAQLNIGDYLKGWQFQYCNTNIATTTGGRCIASALEIISSEEVIFTDNTSNSYLKCVIKMPRYKDYRYGETTLSLYTYHGLVSSATTRTAEVTQLLAAIANDTSDFVIVTGDTNDFTPNKDIWAMFNAAGLTPVHDGKSATVTDRTETIDNIFISEHCSCAYYNVINSSEWMYTPAGASTPQPVSDHDLVYADIVFDFDAAIEARNN